MALAGRHEPDGIAGGEALGPDDGLALGGEAGIRECGRNGGCRGSEKMPSIYARNCMTKGDDEAGGGGAMLRAPANQ